MTDKQKITAALMRYNDHAMVITKSQIAKALGTKKSGDRVERLVGDLDSYDRKYYLVSDVAEAFLRSRG